jgi:hypothetical protein
MLVRSAVSPEALAADQPPMLALLVLLIAPLSPTAAQKLVPGAHEIASSVPAALVDCADQLPPDPGEVLVCAVTPATATQRLKLGHDTPERLEPPAVAAEPHESVGVALAEAANESTAAAPSATAAAHRSRRLPLMGVPSLLFTT